MTIAKKGNFSLRTKTYAVEHTYMTSDIEICEDREGGVTYLIATFSKDGYVVDYGERMFDAMFRIPDAVEDISYLGKIGYLIINSENVESGYKLVD